MDKMEEWEVYNFYEQLKYANKPEWEMTRLLMYVTAQVQSRKKLKMNEILSLPWDKDFNDKSSMPTEITNEEKEALRRQAKEMEKFLQNI